MKLKDSIKLNTVPLNKIYPKESVLPEDGLCRFYISLASNMEIKKDEQQTLSVAKIRIS